jgi:signal transduction histidine kinase/Flp pilus assembly protein TadD
MLKYRVLIFLSLITFSSVFAQLQTRIDSLEALLPAVDVQEKPRILMELSALYQSISIEKSLEYDLQNAALQRKLGSKRNLSGTLNNIGVSYYMLGQYGKSLDYLEQSLELYEDLNDTVNIVKTLNNLGVISQISGQLSNALEFLQESLTFKLNLKDTLSTAKTLNNIGVIYKDVGNYDDAQRFFMQALNFYQTLKDEQGISVVYNNLGQISELEGDTKGALDYFEQSLALKRTTGDERGIGNTLNNIGKVFLDNNELQKAEMYFGEAARVREKIGDKHGEASTLNSLANLYLKQGNYAAAEDYFLQSNQIAEQENLLGIQQRNFFGLSRLFEASGETEKALESYKQFTLTKDSIFSRDLNTQLAHLKVQYDWEKSQRELELLRHQNQIKELELSNARKGQIQLFFVIIILVLTGVFLVLYMQNRNKQRLNKQLSDYNRELELRVKERTKELEEANATKDRFFSIIAHDLRSPFNGLIGFTDLLSESYDDLSEDEKKEFIKLLKDSTNDVYSLLENLLTWASTQTGKLQINKTTIDLGSMANDIVAQNKSAANSKQLNVSVHIFSEQKAYADADSVNTVIRNLLSNAVKFTPRGGNIEIAIDEIQGDDGNKYLRFSIKDNGVGIKPDHLEKLFELQRNARSFGTENETGTGLGLILCKEFMEKNDGALSVESRHGEGSTFSFTLPVA